MFAFDAANTGYVPSADGIPSEPRLQWRGPGSVGNGGFVVARGTVVSTTESALTALDATDGSKTWEQSFDGRTDPSPAVAGDTVVGLGQELRAFDVADGTERWSYGSFEELFGGVTVADGTTYVCVDEGVTAVDVESGERRWRTDFPDVGSTHGPVAVTAGTVVVNASGIGGGVVALDAEDGTERWRVEFETRTSVPRVADGTVYVGVQRAYTDPFERETVYTIDLDTGEVAPFFRTTSSARPSLVVTPEGLLVVSRTRSPPDGPSTEWETVVETNPGETRATPEHARPTRAYGVALDGSEQWTTTIAEKDGPAIGWNLASPVVVGTTAFLVLSSGRLIALDTASGAIQWEVRPARLGRNVVGPVVLDGVAFVRGENALVALA